MFWFKYLLPAFACVGITAASRHKSDVVIHQLAILRNETQQLNQVLNGWDKTFSGAIEAAFKTARVLEATKNATAEIQLHSQRMGIYGALHVKRVTKRLKKEIKITNDILTAVREDFHKIELAETVLNNVIEQQKASQAMNDAIIPKLPRIGRGVGRGLGRKISRIFQGTIDAYALMLGMGSHTESEQLYEKK